jgi:hypothetical protein
MGVYCCLTALLWAADLQAQSSDKGRATPPSNAGLAKAVDFGIYLVRMFPDDPHQVSFHLVTSWISGENHKGMLRYQLTGTTMIPEDPVAQEAFVKRVADCVVVLNFYDREGFVLRKHVVSFILGVNTEGRMNGLYANDALQMDARDYRELIGNSTASGSWNVTWGLK